MRLYAMQEKVYYMQEKVKRRFIYIIKLFYV